MTVAPPPINEIDNGVIEEARRRQRRRRRASASVVVGLGATLTALGILIGSGGGGGQPASGGFSQAGEERLALRHGHALLNGKPVLMGVTLSLQAGNVGVCVRVIDGMGCNGPLPSPTYPIYGGEGGFSPKEKVGSSGEIDALFTSSKVAAVRVAHLGTFKAHSAPGLPPGARQVVFYRPPGSRGTVLGPGTGPQVLKSFEHARFAPALTETLLDSSGHTIRLGKSSTFQLPNSYWHAPQSLPPSGRCAMGSSLPGAHAVWGEVATEIAPDHDLATPGWLTCLDAWFSDGSTNYEAAILLNASSPGKTPAMLWGAVPLAGHPGMVEIPALQREVKIHFPKITRKRAAELLAKDTEMSGPTRARQLQHQVLRAEGRVETFWDVFVPQTVARRVGPAWILVRYGKSLAEQVRFLRSIHLTRMELQNSKAK